MRPGGEHSGLPVLAVVGRPNVGKSTLVNRMIGRREAVTEDVPGVTRDRVTYEAEWNGVRFILIDTGGWDRKVKGMAAQIAAQAERAINDADATLFIVDAKVGATDTDEAVVQVLRKSGKPVLLVANKADDANTELEAQSLWSLGLGEPHCVSALHGRGAGDLLDAAVAMLPEEGSGMSRDAGPRRVALLGKPNVGKSSLLNALAGGERVVVDSVAGTTVDPVDELIELKGRWWWFVDTAGIRRRSKEASGHEYYATLRTQAALDRAEVAVVLVDASEQLSEQDVRIITMVIEAGRALVLAYNKWDLTDEERRKYLEREIERDLVQVPWAPRVNISASHEASHREAHARDRGGAGGLGDPRVARAASTSSSRSSPTRTRTRCVAAGSRASSSLPRCRSARRRSRCSRPGSSRPATAASSSAGCARSSASSARRSGSSCACARSGPSGARPQEAARRGRLCRHRGRHVAGAGSRAPREPVGQPRHGARPGGRRCGLVRDAAHPEHAEGRARRAPRLLDHGVRPRQHDGVGRALGDEDRHVRGKGRGSLVDRCLGPWRDGRADRRRRTAARASPAPGPRARTP